MRTLRRIGALATVACFALGGLSLPSSAATAPVAPTAPLSATTGRPPLFGASIEVPSDVARLSTLLHRQLNSVRVFLGGTPSVWSKSSLLASIPATGTISVSFRSGSPAQIQSFLAGHPRTMTCYATYYHEPEVKFISAAQKANYRALVKSYAPAIRAAGCRPMLILMKWTLSPKSGRNWHDWYAPGAVDALGFDAYNTSARKGSYDVRPDYLAQIQAASKETGLPWAMPEIASDVPAGTSRAERAAWARRVAVAAAADPKFLFADWWDMMSRHGGRDYRLDGPCSAVWHS